MKIKNWIKDFFCKIFKHKPNPEPKKKWWEDGWKIVRERYPRGKRFKYLGREMIVVKYDWDINSSGNYEPYFIAEYSDNNGILHEWVFEAETMPILLKKNK